MWNRQRDYIFSMANAMACNFRIYSDNSECGVPDAIETIMSKFC